MQNNKTEEFKKKHAELQEQLNKERELEIQLETISRLTLTPEAKSRLGNVRLVNKELYFKTIQALIYLKQSGNINGKVSETELKKLLEKFSEKRETRIRRK